MANSGYSCLRRTFCWINILISFCGCLFLGAGVWLHYGFQGYATLLPDHQGLSADFLFIAIGLLSCVISFFGWCGSWFQFRFFLVIYFTLVVLLFLTEFLVGSLAFLFGSGISRALSMDLRDGIELHYNATDRGALAAPSVAAIWDNVQTELQCCGVKSHEDWYDIKSWRNERWVPKSCCRTEHTDQFTLEEEGSGEVRSIADCTKSKDPSLWWEMGCAQALQIWFLQRMHIVGTIGLVIAFIQLFGMISSMLLFCTMKHNRASHTYKSYSPHSGIEPVNQRTRDSEYLNDA